MPVSTKYGLVVRYIRDLLAIKQMRSINWQTIAAVFFLLSLGADSQGRQKSDPIKVPYEYSAQATSAVLRLKKEADKFNTLCRELDRLDKLGDTEGMSQLSKEFAERAKDLKRHFQRVTAKAKGLSTQDKEILNTTRVKLDWRYYFFEESDSPSFVIPRSDDVKGFLRGNSNNLNGVDSIPPARQ